ncbi:complement C3-like [Spea bombifrons]|uniref:complement C3-like n=1 Tax=Spea bombifrons TaxID=233779 RepID=UPI00234BEFBD|nr:complement C3-like [Spea bombifrons]
MHLLGISIPLLYILLWIHISLGAEFFSMMAPNILRVGNEETIVIQAHGYKKHIPLQVTVQSFPRKDIQLFKTTTHLNESNNYLATAHIKVPSSYISKQSDKQYVYVQVQSQSVMELEKAILVSPHSGYLFIQTDKTIYTPNQNVNYRIFSTDTHLEPTQRFVIVSIQNPEGITVFESKRHINDGFERFSFKIPELVTVGIWKIVAAFQDAPKEEYTAQFEVREYVLPDFSVELQTDTSFFYYKNEELVVNIKASYLYGENVNGYAVALFGLYKDFMTVLQKSLQIVQIEDGKGKVILKKSILESIGSMNEHLGSFIYVNVTVFSSGGDYVQTHKTGIKIVSSPYSIAFTKTSRYFKPGMPFRFTVSVTNPDMTPANKITVSCKDGKGTTSEDGLAMLSINTEGNSKELVVDVSTAVDGLHGEQAKARMIAKAYEPAKPFHNFLHIDVRTIDVGTDLDVNLHIKSTSDEIRKEIKYVTILVMSRGKILQTKIENKTDQTVTAVRINVSPDMLPSFRIVAYYYLSYNQPNYIEIVSDSIQMRMRRSCKGTLNIISKENSPTYSPKDTASFSLTGDPGATIGLAVVDKAVFTLNNKYKFTQDKIWDAVESKDIGCTAGSGANALSVFQDAGLDFTTTTGIETPARKDFNCSLEQLGRSRRSIMIFEAKRKKANESPAHLRPCCLAGMQDSPMALSCIKRKDHVRMEKECVDLFFECCQHAEELRAQHSEDLESARFDDSECEDCIPDDDVELRSFFPESFYFETVKLKSSDESTTFSLGIPDSITSWVLQGVSISKNKGICVSKPYEIVVYKSFFVDLKLPYSAVRNEQVQIRAVVYNYEQRTLTVRVRFPYVENTCSLATKTSAYQETVMIPAKSSRAVKYVVIPLKETVNIEVIVQERSRGISDRVRKTLRVQPEGKINRIKRHSEILNPEGGSKLIYIPKTPLTRMVPDSEASNFISIQGDIMAETFLGTLDDTFLGKLIYVPSGCPEQNMFRTSPNVILTQYLDTLGKWETVGAEKRKQAIRHITEGYNTQITYLNPDGSFLGNTWLTAYVMKIFAMASNVVPINNMLICNSAKWLIDKQTKNGDFPEKESLFSRRLQGGYFESDASSSLAAFVLIALSEVESKCNNSDIMKAIKKAERYLEVQLPNLKDTYSVVISSYALALVSNTKDSNKIDQFADKDKTFWPVNNDPASLYTVEATGYALLQKLKLKKYEESHQIAKWLVEQRHFGGGYQSTQATVVAMQALAQYKIDIKTEENVNLNVKLFIEGRSNPVSFTITNENAYLERTVKASANKELKINSTGTGKGTITVMTVYYSFLSDEEQCNGFNLHAQVEEIKEGTYRLIIRARYTGSVPATMSIIEVTMLTGFKANIDDLNKLKGSIENYIMDFQANTINGSIIIYLKEVSNTEDVVIGFLIQQELNVGLLQPADITIYEYYELARRCSTFYNIPDESDQLRKLCKGSACKCAVGNCGALTKITSDITTDRLSENACAIGVDSVFKVLITSSERKASYDYHNATILDVIKEGSDALDPRSQNNKRQFISHMACTDSLHIKTNTQYLIVNYYSDLWESERVYLFSNQTFFVLWPEDGAFTQILNSFSDDMKTAGCKT